MKKKVLALLIAAMSGSLLSGCGTKQQTGAEAKSSIGEEEKADDDKETASSSEEVESDEDEKVLSRVYRIPTDQNIYVDAPGWLTAIDEDVTELYIADHSRLYAVTYLADFLLDHIHSIQDAQEEFKTDLDFTLDNYEGGFNSLNVTSDKNVTINDIDMYYFEGTINYGRSDVDIFDGYTVGYTFIIDGQPVQIIGSVTDKSQPEGLKKEVKATVDAMAESVRTEE